MHDHDINHEPSDDCACDLCVTFRADMDLIADRYRAETIEHMETARPVCLSCPAVVAELGDTCRDCARHNDAADDAALPWFRSWTRRSATGRAFRGGRS